MEGLIWVGGRCKVPDVPLTFRREDARQSPTMCGSRWKVPPEDQGSLGYLGWRATREKNLEGNVFSCFECVANTHLCTMATSTATTVYKRHTFWDELSALDGDKTFKLMAEIDDHILQSIGFRHGSNKTMARQDKILRFYEATLNKLKCCTTNETQDDAERHKLLWPAVREHLKDYCKRFLYAVVKLGRGRARDAVHIKYRTLSQYRTALLYWAGRAYRPYHKIEFPQVTIYNDLTEMMRYLAKLFNLDCSRPRNGSELGIEELRLLIDYDMTNTKYIDMAEQHHLAWCLGRLCAVRPGSLGEKEGAERERHLFLTWRDVTIVVEEPGCFTVQIVFRSLKTAHEKDSEAATAQAAGYTLTCTITSPKLLSNIIFSVPHRLLVIALRRGAIEGLNTIDEVREYSGHRILIKPGFLDQPVFFAGLPGGRGLSSEPMSAQALSAYLKLRGEMLGFVLVITFYSLRRRSARDLTDLLGCDTARAIMNHAPDTRTLEMSYYEPVQHLNLTTLGLGEGGDTNLSIKQNPHNLAMTRVDEHAVCRVSRKKILRAMVAQMIARDDQYPTNATPSERRSYNKRVLRAANDELRSREEIEQRSKLSVIDGTRVVIRDIDEIFGDEGEEEAEAAVPWKEAAVSFMEVLMANGMSVVRDLKKQPIHCPLCLEDETMEEAAKNKLWDDKYRLGKHMGTSAHSK
ncbi:hypothetical protein GE09DRAFT_1239454 [Coniochaeta sp. 2T2.1]|nr:hypothetical protein GE09DRAFT_1239454 [Coniochaeta sp. 2T2.1]